MPYFLFTRYSNQVSQVCLHEGESEQLFYGSTEDKHHISTMAYKALTDINLPAVFTTSSFHYFSPYAPATLVFFSSVLQMLHVPSFLIRILTPAVLSTWNVLHPLLPPNSQLFLPYHPDHSLNITFSGTLFLTSYTSSHPPIICSHNPPYFIFTACLTVYL